MLKNPKSIWVLGATSGVGLETAKAFAKEGHEVLGTTSDIEKAKVKFEFPLPFPLIEMDLANEASRMRGLQEALEASGVPDVVVFNAGSGEIGSIEDTSIGVMRTQFEVNYFGHLFVLKSLLPSMRERQSGHLIFLGSVVYSLPFPFKATYSASKSALSSLALSLRQEVRPHGLHVHLLEPGWIRSNFHNTLKAHRVNEGVYNDRLTPFEDHSRDRENKYPDGKRVASIIQNLVRNPTKKTRIVVGPDAKVFFLVRRFLSWSWIEKILLNKY